MTLPANMRAKIAEELCPVAGLDGFCWTWTGCVNSRGYGCVAVGGKSHLAHRIAYEIHRGLIPTGLQIDHLCVNKRCINPAHLEAVTGKVNAERAHPSTKTVCVNGHRYTDENTIWRTRGALKHRACRECENARRRNVRRNRVSA